MVEKHVDFIESIEEAVVNGDQAVIERMVNRSRWGMDEGESVTGSTNSNPATPEVVPSKPQVVTEYDGDQPRNIFKPGVDFHNGGSIPF